MELSTQIRNAFPEFVDTEVIRFCLPLRDYCSFRIGGPAEVFCLPGSLKQLHSLLEFVLVEQIPYFIIGRGSNLLISDHGLAGLVISTSRLNIISHDGDYVSAWCGVELKELCLYAQSLGLAGLEFAYGIPGSVGGAVFMNAGAYGGEISDVLYCSKYLSPDLDLLRSTDPVKHLKSVEHEFSYRSSAFQTKGLIHLSSVFHLHRDDPEAILGRMRELERQRWAKQPLDLPSAGSVFRRPPGHFTGKLIEDCALRGYRIGGAAISEKHCGFIVNLGGASARDVLSLIRHVQKVVWERCGVKLEPEIRFVGRE